MQNLERNTFTIAMTRPVNGRGTPNAEQLVESPTVFQSRADSRSRERLKLFLSHVLFLRPIIRQEVDAFPLNSEALISKVISKTCDAESLSPKSPSPRVPKPLSCAPSREAVGPKTVEFVGTLNLQNLIREDCQIQERRIRDPSNPTSTELARNVVRTMTQKRRRNNVRDDRTPRVSCPKQTRSGTGLLNKEG